MSGSARCGKRLRYRDKSTADFKAELPQARLLIAGDGPERAKLEQQAAHQGVSQHVEFLGWVAPEQVWALINTSTLVLMPSRHESLPLVALEAALMARPLVAMRVGGLPEVVAHERTGLLVNPADPEAFAAAVELLLNDEALAVGMGKLARARCQENFSWQTHVDRYDTLYRRLAARS